jgi:precorrin-2 dehydrogenase/sirohydrochlorin ferrochelatase
MLPLFIDVSRLELLLAGNGPAAVKRLRLLEEAGARSVTIHADAPSSDLESAAEGRLVRRWPLLAEIARARLIFVADVPPTERERLAAAARAAGVLAHVEDTPALSDAAAAAVLRRGDLTVAVSTGGASPALAVHVRDFLGGLFGPEWDDRLELLSRQRRAWRDAGIAPERIADLTEEWVSCRGWLARPFVPA